jgi:exodeoxyribonuclease III
MAAELTLGTWNVNSVRVRLEHLLRVLVEWRPDVLCLQETKVEDEKFPLEPIEALGYRAALSGQKTYNGVAILARHPLQSVRKGFDGRDREEQKRLIAATVRGIRVVNAYIPNGGEVGSDKFADKLSFLERLRAYFDEQHKPSEPVVLVGDFNVAPAPEDVWDPAALDGTTCYHPDERSRLETLRKWGFRDQFRRFESAGGHFTWWDYREGAWPRNAGLRIDHVWASTALDKRARACLIEREERGREKASDHVPVIAAYAVD